MKAGFFLRFLKNLGKILLMIIFNRLLPEFTYGPQLLMLNWKKKKKHISLHSKSSNCQHTWYWPPARNTAQSNKCNDRFTKQDLQRITEKTREGWVEMRKSTHWWLPLRSQRIYCLWKHLCNTEGRENSPGKKH